MAWSTTDLTLISYGGTSYLFAPTELVYSGDPRQSGNQVVQESEAGQIKVVELDSSTRSIYEFRIDKMPYADRSVGGSTIRGYSTLKTLIESSLNFRQNTCSLSPTGTSFATLVTVRLMQDEIFAPMVISKGTSYTDRLTLYGDGSQKLVFRLEL